MLATWKLLVALVLVPLLYNLYALLFGLYLLNYRHCSVGQAILGSQLFLGILPVIGYAAIRFGETGSDLYRYVK